MTWFRKKNDPISDRERALQDEIAALEVQIKQLDSQLQHNPSQPRLRSTALPHSAAESNNGGGGASASVAEEPVFEEVGPTRLHVRTDAPATPEHFNELGVRKYDLVALLRRIRNHFQGPSTTNPKLVSYLAAGGIQGLRPLRYEKRVARNRFIVLVIGLFLLLLGLLATFYRQHR
jgi:hypothetical protein